MQGREKQDIPKKIRRPAASSGTIPTCRNFERPRLESNPARLCACGGGGETALAVAPLRPQQHLFASQQGEPSLILGRVTPGFSHVGIRCRWSAGFLGDLPFTPPFHSGTAPYIASSSSALNTSLLKAA
ncbi:hypothetical protein PR048_024690 [Dryococelus australis]|uniref:Uncharacterized protein n=1 Tax=Dryococelus australis TaxID=614101 RepID=A0ABQ9GPC6_9NEOP|nr:hypothetical protein PR048_024690 [Dryococelus australis]